MKLSDIENTNSSVMNKKMREKLGWNLNLNAMTVESAKDMMESIDSKLSTVRSSHKLHESQKNPNYMGMIMAKKILEKYVTEAKGKPDFADIDGDGDTKEPMKKAAKEKKKVSETELKVDEKAVSKAQQQAAGIALSGKNLKGASKEMSKMPKKELEKFAKTKSKDLPKHVSESRRRLTEDELGQAQAMLAAKDMVDSMQDMIEDISKMLNEQLPPLTDSIRTAIGSTEADGFKASASSTLSSLLTTVQTSRDAMDQAVRTLSGEPAANAMGGMGADMGAPDAGMGAAPTFGDEDMGLPDEEGDDFGAADAAAGGDLPLGREKR